MTLEMNGIRVTVDYSKLEVVFSDNNETKTVYFNNEYSINKFLDGLV